MAIGMAMGMGADIPIGDTNMQRIRSPLRPPTIRRSIAASLLFATGIFLSGCVAAPGYGYPAYGYGYPYGYAYPTYGYGYPVFGSFNFSYWNGCCGSHWGHGGWGGGHMH